MESIAKKFNIDSALNMIVRAMLFVVLANLLIFFLPTSYHDLIFKELQVALPILSMLLAVRLYLTSVDRNVKYLAMVLSLAFALNTLSNVAWSLIPAFIVNDFTQSDLFYYIGGMGWLIGYGAVAYALYKLKHSMQWYARPALDRRITIAGVVAAFIVALMIFLAIRWDNPRLFDIFILLIYLFCDILVIMMSAKLLSMNLKLELKYILFAIVLFFAINMVGDLLFQYRWLSGNKYIMSFKVLDLTDYVYDTALMLMTISLFLYSSEWFKSRALEEIGKSLKDTQLFVDDLITHSPDATCIFDKDGNLLLVNDVFLRIFGTSRGKLDQSFNIFRHLADERRKQFARMLKVRDGETVIIPKMSIPRYKDRDLYVYVKMFPTYASDGKIANYVLIIDDITERVKLEDDLFKAYSSLKEEYERKMDFTNTAAHELRTPLTPIIGYTEIMKAEIKDERYGKYLEIIERNAQRQKTIVNRMLQLASLDAGTEVVDYREIDPLPLLSEIADNYRAVNRNIHVDVPAGLMVFTDASILAQIVDNLVSNAVKYSEKDKEINIRVQDTGDHYQFSVEDHGQGIPKEEQEKIFERFYIVGGDRDDRSGGRVGLGLALVKAYIKLLNGRLWVESEPGKGSTFHFTLPMPVK